MEVGGNRGKDSLLSASLELELELAASHVKAVQDCFARVRRADFSSSSHYNQHSSPMVHCIACLQRCIRAVVAVQKPRGSLYHPPIAFRTIDHVSAFRHRRGYGTAATVEAALRPNDGVQPEENSESTRPPNEDKQTQDEAHDEATAADQGRKREKDLRREIRTELEYIRDPLKLGDRVISGLRDGEVDKMIDLVHEASKDMDCTVSWNHLVNYHMEEGKVKMALKIYNDVS